jgi:hypothetical protein
MTGQRRIYVRDSGADKSPMAAKTNPRHDCCVKCWVLAIIQRLCSVTALLKEQKRKDNLKEALVHLHARPACCAVTAVLAQRWRSQGAAEQGRPERRDTDTTHTDSAIEAHK